MTRHMEKWLRLLPKEAAQAARFLSDRAAEERRRKKSIFPSQDHIFRALELTPPEQVSCCIIGQDPYPTRGHANGLAFSVNDGVALPRSLKNIFRELSSDIGCDIPASGDLTKWAQQGVLLLNTVLTVEEGRANSHIKWGWQELTFEIVRVCASLPQPIVFILWGGQARAFAAPLSLSGMRHQKKACIWSSHPSPLGATRGNEVVPAFLGSRPFSKTNRLLVDMGGSAITWDL